MRSYNKISKRTGKVRNRSFKNKVKQEKRGTPDYVVFIPKPHAGWTPCSELRQEWRLLCQQLRHLRYAGNTGESGSRWGGHLRNTNSFQHSARLKEPLEIVSVSPWVGRKQFQSPLYGSQKLDSVKWHSESLPPQIKQFSPQAMSDSILHLDWPHRISG